MCDYKNAINAAGELSKSTLVFFAGIASILFVRDLVHIPNCIAEVLFEFVIGGLTLQICIGLGSALINCILEHSAAHFAIGKLIESILEPIVLVGGFYSIYLFIKEGKSSPKAKHAKYSAIGNLIGSSIAVCLASYLCFEIEKAHHTSTSNQFTGMKDRDIDENLKDLFGDKHVILGMNVLARIFAEAIARCLEHRCTKKIHV